MRLLTKYNTQGWVLSGGHVLDNALDYCLRRGRLFGDQDWLGAADGRSAESAGERVG